MLYAGDRDDSFAVASGSTALAFAFSVPPPARFILLWRVTLVQHESAQLCFRNVSAKSVRFSVSSTEVCRTNALQPVRRLIRDLITIWDRVGVAAPICPTALWVPLVSGHYYDGGSEHNKSIIATSSRCNGVVLIGDVQ